MTNGLADNGFFKSVSISIIPVDEISDFDALFVHNDKKCINAPFQLRLEHMNYRHKWANAWQNQQNHICAQQRLRSAWSESSLSAWKKPYLPTEHILKTDQPGCPGWSQSSRGAHHFEGFIMLWLILIWSLAHVISMETDHRLKVDRKIKLHKFHWHYSWIRTVNQPKPSNVKSEKWKLLVSCTPIMYILVGLVGTLVGIVGRLLPLHVTIYNMDYCLNLSMHMVQYSCNIQNYLPVSVHYGPL